MLRRYHRNPVGRNRMHREIKQRRPNMEASVREAIIDLVDYIDPTPRGGYALWILRLILTENIIAEDGDKMREWLTDYYRLAKRNRAITRRYPLSKRGISSKQELAGLMRRLLPDKYSVESIPYELPGVVEFSDISPPFRILKCEGEVGIPSAQKLAEGTGWCTEGESQARHYLEENPLIIILKEDKPYVQAHIGLQDGLQVKDINDDEILESFEIPEYKEAQQLLDSIDFYQRAFNYYERRLTSDSEDVRRDAFYGIAATGIPEVVSILEEILVQEMRDGFNSISGDIDADDIHKRMYTAALHMANRGELDAGYELLYNVLSSEGVGYPLETVKFARALAAFPPEQAWKLLQLTPYEEVSETDTRKKVIRILGNIDSAQAAQKLIDVTLSWVEEFYNDNDVVEELLSSAFRRLGQTSFKDIAVAGIEKLVYKILTSEYYLDAAEALYKIGTRKAFKVLTSLQSNLKRFDFIRCVSHFKLPEAIELLESMWAHFQRRRLDEKQLIHEISEVVENFGVLGFPFIERLTSRMLHGRWQAFTGSCKKFAEALTKHGHKNFAMAAPIWCNLVHLTLHKISRAAHITSSGHTERSSFALERLKSLDLVEIDEQYATFALDPLGKFIHDISQKLPEIAHLDIDSLIHLNDCVFEYIKRVEQISLFHTTSLRSDFRYSLERVVTGVMRILKRLPNTVHYISNIHQELFNLNPEKWTGIRINAVHALGFARDPQAIPYLQQIVNTKGCCPAEHYRAISGLARTPEGIEVLKAMLSDDIEISWDLRPYWISLDDIARGIGDSNTPAAFDLFRYMLYDRKIDPRMRTADLAVAIGVEAMLDGMDWDNKIHPVYLDEPLQYTRQDAYKLAPPLLAHILDHYTDNASLYFAAIAYEKLGLKRQALSIYEQISDDPDNRMRSLAKKRLTGRSRRTRN